MSDARVGQHSTAFDQKMHSEHEEALPSLYKCPQRTYRVLKLLLVIKSDFLNLDFDPS